jgi:beta-phosphoglucomutase
MENKVNIKACIFDLDGVIVDTAKYHYLAWRRLANELGLDFSAQDNEQLKGVSRMESLDIILAWGGVSIPEREKIELAEKKNAWYKSYIADMDASEILPGVLDFLHQLEEANIRIALGSASKNAEEVLSSLGIRDRFEVVVDGHQTTRSKPDPEVFLLAAQKMQLQPSSCIVFEDAAVGVEAALAGGFYTIGVGQAEVLGAAHQVIPDFTTITIQDLIHTFNP